VLNNQPVDLRTIVRDAADAAESITQGQAIALDLPDEPLVANADPNRLSQVLMNLLKNAIIYAPDTERIEVQLQPAEKAAEMRVRDYGPGVPPAERERIFARFTQLEPGSSQRNHSDGLGLGLYIAREIVVAHGGTITLDESVEPGATFVVRLPLNADQSS
jgi:two-component system OmpR family sensor kinase